ncbi:FHA domain-containing protein [Streptomyces boninensis]|uniref:FHA domain-containing protein n=1 Tax=Streptomyces boninensis TaxID=2039455 RepID=UPI003B211B6E
MATCPNGHQSAADDWCEVCGIRMAPPGSAAPAAPGAPGGPSVPPPPPPPGVGGYGYPAQPGPPPPPGADPSYPGDPTQQAELCPQCNTPREAQAPFCEECRYNFLTHSATSYVPPAQPAGFSRGTRPPAREEYRPSRPSQVNRAAEPLSMDPAGPGAAGPAGPGGAVGPPPPPPPVPGAGPGIGAPDGPPPPPPAPGTGGYGYPGQPAAPAPAPAPSSPPPGGGDPRANGSSGDFFISPPSGSEPGAQGPEAPLSPSAAGWVAVVTPDREYFTAMMSRSGPEASGLNLPAYSPEQKITLTGPQITIGRRRQSTGESPDIDLARPPEDPGVSHQHAVLVEQPDGTWSVVDQNSTNGTTVNGAADPIQPFVPVPLQEGDRVHVGAWTTIRLQRG